MTIVFLKDNWEDSLNLSIKEYEDANNRKPYLYANPNITELWRDDSFNTTNKYKGCDITFLDSIPENQVYLGRKDVLFCQEIF